MINCTLTGGEFVKLFMNMRKEKLCGMFIPHCITDEQSFLR